MNIISSKNIVLILVIILIIVFVLNSGCDSTDPTPQPEKPPGYQEDIPWLSLADSPWPITFGNPQFTKRSRSIGGQAGILKVIDLPFSNQTGFAIGQDSTIYYTAAQSVYSDTSGLVAIDFEGKLKWIYPFSVYQGSPNSGCPIIANDGTIYATSYYDQKVFVINPDGTLKWEINNIKPYSYMNLGKDGTLYLFASLGLQSSEFVAINKDGNTLWRENIGLFSDNFLISPDGNSIYFSRAEEPFNPVVAFDLKNRSIKWEYSEAYIVYKAWFTDCSGNICFLGKTKNENDVVLFKLDDTGRTIWNYTFGNRSNYNNDGNFSISLDKKGNTISVLCDTVYSISYEGRLNWKNALKNNLNGLVSLYAAGNSYFAISNDYSSPDITFSSFNEFGDVRWTTEAANINSSYGYFYPSVIGYGKSFFIGYKEKHFVRIE